MNYKVKTRVALYQSSCVLHTKGIWRQLEIYTGSPSYQEGHLAAMLHSVCASHAPPKTDARAPKHRAVFASEKEELMSKDAPLF